MKKQNSYLALSIFTAILCSCGQQPRVDGSKEIKQELYDRKIRRITQDMFVTETLILGDSLNRSINNGASSILDLQKQAQNISQSTGFKVGVYNQDSKLSGTQKEIEMYSSALSYWQMHKKITPLAQKIGDTAWMYAAPAILVNGTQKDTVGVMGAVFPIKLLIRKMNMKGVG